MACIFYLRSSKDLIMERNTYAGFKHSDIGRRLAEYLAQSETRAALEASIRAGEPAVAAIDPWAAHTLPPATKTEKQHAGRMVRDTLIPLGWRVDERVKYQPRVRGGRYFSSGSVYRPVAVPVHTAPIAAFPPSEADDPLTRAQRILAAARLDPDKPLGTVDDFLRERRAMWGEA